MDINDTPDPVLTMQVYKMVADTRMKMATSFMRAMMKRGKSPYQVNADDINEFLKIMSDRETTDEFPGFANGDPILVATVQMIMLISAVQFAHDNLEVLSKMKGYPEVSRNLEISFPDGKFDEVNPSNAVMMPYFVNLLSDYVPSFVRVNPDLSVVTLGVDAP